MEADRLTPGTMRGRLAPTRVSASRLPALLFAAAVPFGCGGPDAPRPITLPSPSPPSPPGVPLNLRVTEGEASFIRWQWDPVSGAAGYQVQVSVGDDDFDPPDEQAVLPASQTAAEFGDPELTPGTAVHLRVRAFTGSAGSPVYGPFSPTVPGLVPASPATDRMALEAFFHATGGPGWDDNTGWLTSAPLGEWYGVEADTDGRVTGLDLRFNDVTGEIPPELGHLTSLAELTLGGDDCFGLVPGRSLNELRGEIPPELGQLKNLTTLDLRRLDLSGEIPPELGGMTNLAELRLNGNRLSGELPPELGDLSNLRTLVLGGDERCTILLVDPPLPPPASNRLVGEIPPELGRLVNLRHLDLSSNGFAGEIPPELGSLTNLTTLNLSYNLLAGAIPESFLDLRLQSLEIRRPEHFLANPHHPTVCAPPGPRFSAWLASIGYLLPSPFPRCSS